jgi:hypothetical protein
MCIEFNIPGGASSHFSSRCRGRIRECRHGSFICLWNVFACAKRWYSLSLSQAVARSEWCNVQWDVLNVVGCIVMRSLSSQIVSLVMYSELCALLSCGIMCPKVSLWYRLRIGWQILTRALVYSTAMLRLDSDCWQLYFGHRIRSSILSEYSQCIVFLFGPAQCWAWTVTVGCQIPETDVGVPIFQNIRT